MGVTVTIKCPKCGQDTWLHKPEMIRSDGPFATQVTVVYPHGIEDRRCKNCRSVIGVVFSDELPLNWVAFDLKETNRIIEAGPLPLDVMNKLKAVK